jgi:hypothetical protein
MTAEGNWASSSLDRQLEVVDEDESVLVVRRGGDEERVVAARSNAIRATGREPTKAVGDEPLPL